MTCNPILIDEDGVIIAGHGRLQAAKKLGLTTAPTVVLPGLSADQKRLLRIADNKIALNAAWDVDLLKVELQDIMVSDLDIEISGFEIGEIDVLLDARGDPDDDQVPDPPSSPVIRPGEIWQLGKHRIACGDSRDAKLLSSLMESRTSQAAFLDPPYNVPISGYATGRGKIRHRDFAMASGEMTPEEFKAFLSETLANCASVSDDGAVHFICMDHHHSNELIMAAETVYSKRLNICVWVKSNAGLGKLYRSQHELIFVYRVGDRQHRNNIMLGKHGRNRTNVWHYPSVNGFNGSRSADLALHPTVKPVAMVADAIKDVAKPGDIVLDAFLGAGSTLIAAERCGRICYGLDIDPHYVEVALDRWMALTGIEPILMATGETLSARRKQALEATSAA